MVKNNIKIIDKIINGIKYLFRKNKNVPCLPTDSTVKEETSEKKKPVEIKEPLNSKELAELARQVKNEEKNISMLTLEEINALTKYFNNENENIKREILKMKADMSSMLKRLKKHNESKQA